MSSIIHEKVNKSLAPNFEKLDILTNMHKVLDSVLATSMEGLATFLKCPQ